MRTSTICAAILATTVVAGCEQEKKTPEGNGTGAASTAASATAAAATAAAMKVSQADMATGYAKKLTAAFAARDAAKVAALYAPDGVSQLMGDPDVEHGRAEIEKNFSEVFGRYKDATLTVGRIWTSKTASVIEFVHSGTRSPGELMGTKVTEPRPVGLLGAVLVTFDDTGLAKSSRTYLDIASNIGQVEPKLLPAGVKIRPVTTTLPAGAGTFESKGTPDETKNLDVANRLFSAMDTHKVDDLVALTSDDYTFDDVTSPGPMKKADMKQMASAFLSAFPDTKVTKPTQFAAGDYVVTETVFDGTFKAAMAPFKPTDKPVTSHALDVIQVKDGKIVKEWSYGNGAEFLSQIGVMKLPAKSTEKTPIAGAAVAAPAAANAKTQH